MNYSLKTFFPYGGNYVIHFIEDDPKNNKRQNLSLILYEEESKYRCRIVNTKNFLKFLLSNDSHLHSSMAFETIGTQYIVGMETFDFGDDIIRCISEKGFNIIFNPEFPKSGSFGSIYLLAEKEKEKELIIKLVLPSQKDPRFNEGLISRFASYREIGPFIPENGMWSCCNLFDKSKNKSEVIHFIVMEKYEINLYDLFRTHILLYLSYLKTRLNIPLLTLEIYNTIQTEIIEYVNTFYEITNDIIINIIKKLEAMQSVNLEHGDLHLGNIMLKFKGKDIKNFDKLAFIDFGFSKVEDYMSYNPFSDTNNLLFKINEMIETLTKLDKIILSRITFPLTTALKIFYNVTVQKYKIIT